MTRRPIREKRVVVLALATSAVLACSGADVVPEDVLPSEGPWASVAERPCPDDTYLHWENFGEPFVRSWCTGCHSTELAEDRREEAPLDVNFDSIDGVREQMDLVWALAADQNAIMPPAGGPGPEERALLGEWLACGAPTRIDLDEWE